MLSRSATSLVDASLESEEPVHPAVIEFAQRLKREGPQALTEDHVTGLRAAIRDALDQPELGPLLSSIMRLASVFHAAGDLETTRKLLEVMESGTEGLRRRMQAQDLEERQQKLATRTGQTSNHRRQDWRAPAPDGSLSAASLLSRGSGPSRGRRPPR